MHVPRAERAARWRAYAQADREAAQRLAADLWHVACFHAQQASDKALKGLLTQIQGDVVPTHVAHVLLGALAELGESAPPDVVVAANALDRYYIPARYPDALDFADARLMYTVLRWCDDRMAAQAD